MMFQDEERIAADNKAKVATANFNVNLSDALQESPQIVAAKYNYALDNDMPYELARTMDNNSLRTRKGFDTVDPATLGYFSEEPVGAAIFKDDIEQFNDFVLKQRNQVPLDDAEKIPAAKQQKLDEIKALEQMTAIASYMRSIGMEPDDLSDADLRLNIDEISKKHGIDLAFDWRNVDLSRFRKAGVLEAGFGEFLNLFGARDIAGAVKTFVTDYDSIMAANENSPEELLQQKLELMKLVNLHSRGETTGAQLLDTLWGSINMGLEIGATVAAAGSTGGVGGAPGAAGIAAKQGLKYTLKKVLTAASEKMLKNIIKKQGVKGVGKALGAIAKAEAYRLPAYTGKVIAKAYEDYKAAPALYIGEDGVEYEIPENTLADFGSAILHHALDTYTQNFTERTGALLPSVNFVPKKFRTALGGRFVKMLNNDPVKGRMISNLITDNMPLNGVLGEVAEEEFAMMANAFYTTVGDIAGVDFLDYGNTLPFGTWEDQQQILLASTVLSGIGKAVRLPGAIKATKRVTDYLDKRPALVDALSKIKASKGSPAVEKAMVDYVTGGDRDMYFTAESAETLFQNAPEFAKGIGITEETVNKAKNSGDLIAVSDNQLLVTQAQSASNMKIGQEFVEQAVYLDGSTLKEIKETDLNEKTAETAMAIQQKRQKFNQFVNDMKANGFSHEAVQAGMILKSISDYLDRESLLMQENSFFDRLALRFMTEEEFRNEFTKSSSLSNLASNIGITADDLSVLAEVRSLKEAGETKKAEKLLGKVYGNISSLVAEALDHRGEMKLPWMTAKLKDDGTVDFVTFDGKVRNVSGESAVEEITGMLINHAANIKESLEQAKLINDGSMKANAEIAIYKAFLSGPIKNKAIGLSLECGRNARNELIGKNKDRVVENGIDENDFYTVLQNIETLLPLAKPHQPIAKGKKTEDAYNKRFLNIAVKIDKKNYLVRFVAHIPKPKGDKNYKENATPKLYWVEMYKVKKGAPYGGSTSTMQGTKRNQYKPNRRGNSAKWSFIPYGDYNISQIWDAVKGDIKTITQKDFSNDNTLFQVSPVWTGSAASYDAPSLQYIGTGEGQQVYGWGLYGSSERGIGEDYAEADARNKGRGKVLLDGVPFPEAVTGNQTARYVLARLDDGDTDSADSLVKLYEYLISESKKAVAEGDTSEQEYVDGWSEELSWLLENKERITFIPRRPTKGNRHLYKQTFWADREHNLIDWDKAVPDNIMQKVRSQLEKEGNGYLKSAFVNTSGETLYNQITTFTGSPKAASEFLYRAGIDGITYIGNSSGVRNYVAFSDKDIRIDEHIVFQRENTVTMGATTISDDLEASISLFENANTTTIIHEAGHYLVEMMRKLIAMDAASENMKKDFAVLDNWVKKQSDDLAEQKEILADAFVKYVAEGKAPQESLRGAFGTLKRLLMACYNIAFILGMRIEDDVRMTFDNILATERTVQRGSVTSMLEELFDISTLALSKKDAAQFDRLFTKAREQEESRIAEQKENMLKEQRSIWRAQAKQLVDNDKIYQAWQHIVSTNEDNSKNLLDFTAVAETVGNDTALALRDKGLLSAAGRAKVSETGTITYPNAKPGLHPAQVAADFGFASVEQLLDALDKTVSPQEFIKNFVAENEADFHRNFEFTEYAAANDATIKALDRVRDLIAAEGGIKDNLARKKIFQREVREELSRSTVGEILNGRDLQRDCKNHVRNIVKSVGKNDYTTAFAEMLVLQKLVEKIRQREAIRSTINKVIGDVKKAVNAKPGTIDGDFQYTVQFLAYKFGIVDKLPKEIGSIDEAVRRFDENQGDGFSIREALPPGILENINVRIPVNALAFDQLDDEVDTPPFTFADVAAVISIFAKEGRDEVSADKKNFVEQRDDLIKNIKEHLAGLKHKPIKDNHPVGNYIAQGMAFFSRYRKLRDRFLAADNYNKNGLFSTQLYAPLNESQSEAGNLAFAITEALNPVWEQLNESSKNWDYTGLPAFPDDVQQNGYTAWDKEKLVMACLYMGTESSRQRLIRGFNWTEEDLAEIASRLSAADWKNINTIWQMIGSSVLTESVKSAFREKYHYSMKTEMPYAFEVETSDGETVVANGGYIPIDYLFLRDGSDRLDIPVQGDKNAGGPAPVTGVFRPSFSHDRMKNVNAPLKLGIDTIVKHVFSASHFATHWKSVRMALAVMGDRKLAQEFKATQGAYAYDQTVDLIKNVANPESMYNSGVSDFERFFRAGMTAMSLWGNLGTVAMQPTSITIGLDEIKGYWLDAVSDAALHYSETRDFVFQKSSLMRDRSNQQDLDLRKQVDAFRDDKLKKIFDKVKNSGYSLMQKFDAGVALPGWLARYRKALADGSSEKEAIAVADDFVAKTQGATRPIDLSHIQLTQLGRMLAVFYSAASATQNYMQNTFGSYLAKQTTGGELIYSMLMCTFVPALLAALVRFATSGDDDDPDRNIKAFAKELLTYPVQGIPVLRDAADYGVGKIVGEKHGQRKIFSMNTLRGVEEVFSKSVDSIDAATDGNFPRFVYKASLAVGALTGLPVVQVYDRTQKNISSIFPEVLPDLNKITKTKK